MFSRPVDYRRARLSPNEAWQTVTHAVDAIVHCAFAHLPGRYRGGEGNDPDGFEKANLDGTLALAVAAKHNGVRTFIFLSSRAVYDGIEAGTVLTEDMQVAPTSLYGRIKHEVERALADRTDAKFNTFSIRATGIYGPGPAGQTHKWASLFDEFLREEPISPRVATELHGDDLADAVARLLSLPCDQAPWTVCNASDIVLDRHDLLAAFARTNRVRRRLPPRADASSLKMMDCTRLRSLGWAPRGRLDLTGMVGKP
jgi:nucleoside-diphosphate-sugar epimerase